MARQDTLITRNVTFTAERREWVFPNPAPAMHMIGISLDRTNWNNPTATVTLGLQISRDGMKTWEDWCSFTDTGAQRTNSNGSLNESAMFASTAPPAGVRVKAFAYTNGQNVRQAVSLIEVT